MIKLTFEEFIARFNKKELEQMRDDVFKSKDLCDTEKLERIQLVEIAIEKRSKRGRPSKPKELKQDKKLTANVTKAEQGFMYAKAKRLGYRNASDYFRHICFNLTPCLNVNETKLPSAASEDFITDTMAGVVSLLQYSLMQEKLTREEVMGIFNNLQDIRQVVTDHQQQRIGQFDQQTALVIANQFLTADQLQELADNKALNDELLNY
ncbi:hypothetical protein [Vibrio cyclitrophicus]|uniref:hypothetical protein n=1 Tax=Vibrio cyclitrophicus TaxID=47951 RepID=UPI0011B78A55|nr:hypothetical protein [Vibrio cyclitrophicus]